MILMTTTAQTDYETPLCKKEEEEEQKKIFCCNNEEMSVGPSTAPL